MVTKAEPFTIVPVKSLVSAFRVKVKDETRAVDVALQESKRAGYVITVPEVLDRWEKERQDRRIINKLLRVYTESLLGGQFALPDTKPLGILGQFDKFWNEQKVTHEVLQGFVNKTLVSSKLKVKGLIDCVLLDKKTQVTSLWRWATGRNLAASWTNMLPPFDDLPDSRHTRISLEMSFLRIAIEYGYDVDIDSCHITLFSEDSYIVGEALDLRELILESDYSGYLENST